MNGFGAMSRGLSTYTELLACLAFVRHGYDVGIPLPFGTPWIGFDLLAKLFPNRDYQRIQVKAAKAKDGVVIVRTVRREKHNKTDVKQPYRGHEFDYLLAIERRTGVMWILPMSEVAGLREVTLSGRTPWIGALELPSLQEIVLLSRLLAPRAIPDQELLPFGQEGVA